MSNVLGRFYKDLLLIFSFLLLTLLTAEPSTASQLCPGCYGNSPGYQGVAISQDGSTAYVVFSIEDAFLVVDLSTFKVISQIDVSAAGVQLGSGNARLSPDGTKCWVVNWGVNNVMVVNVVTGIVEWVMDIPFDQAPLYQHWDCVNLSADGLKAYIVGNNGALFIVDTTNYTYTVQRIPFTYIHTVEPSVLYPNHVYAYVDDSTPPGESKTMIILYDLETSTIVKSEVLTGESAAGLSRFVVSPDETKAYFGNCQHLHTGEGQGHLNAFDLINFELIASESIVDGVQDFALNITKGKIYTAGFNQLYGNPGVMPITEWDTSSDSITGTINASSFHDMTSILVDPSNPDFFYATDADANTLQKIDITNGNKIAEITFNESNLFPLSIEAGENYVYVSCLRVPTIYKLDARNGRIVGTFQPPSGIGSGPVLSYKDSHLYFNWENLIHKMRASDGKVLATYDHGIADLASGHLTFFGNKAAMIDQVPGGRIGRRIIFFDANNWQMLEQHSLPAVRYCSKITVSPDESKLYTLRLMDSGSEIVTYDVNTLTEIKTVSVGPGTNYDGGVSQAKGYFDLDTRRLYFPGADATYVLDMDTDQLINVLVHQDVFQVINGGWPPTAPRGLFPNPTGDKLLLISMDSHCMYVYDLLGQQWMPEIVNLRGLYVHDASLSSDGQYIFTVNRTDSVTMANAATRQVEKIIDLYRWRRPTMPWLPLLLIGE